MATRAIPSVTPTSDATAFFKATEAGQFSLPVCEACGQTHWYPRPLCPHCFSDRIIMKPASGRGKIHTFTVMRRAPEVYAVAYIELAEGPIMLSNLVDFEADALAIDQPVEVVLTPNADGLKVPLFRPL
jgi:uncharacterized OB-fold protein